MVGLLRKMREQAWWRMKPKQRPRPRKSPRLRSRPTRTDHNYPRPASPQRAFENGSGKGPLERAKGREAVLRGPYPHPHLHCQRYADRRLREVAFGR